ncbi:hypothetical protein [Vibrio metoecus]|uniref:hypothetical protein n=1 Tax=Vibrio metoecus TaxID=1481663 RepID=UPI00215C5B6E|nr:hypothetical protein [Vibrio metoecus]MCR9387276.1 hypothetical protein [Vibrio metoecus]
MEVHRDMDLKDETPIMRVLHLLTRLAQQDSLSLEQAHLLTGLSKATLTRAFLSLEHAGWAHRYLGNDQYTYLPPEDSSPHTPAIVKKRLAVLAKPILQGLHHMTGLSTDFAVMFDELEIVESSFGLTDSRLGKRVVIGLGVNLEHSSMGKAYSAALSGEHQSGQYYVRTKHFWDYKELKQIFNISAIAIPLICQQTPIGALNLAWFDSDESSYDEDDIANRFLPALQHAVECLIDRIQQSDLNRYVCHSGCDATP